QNDIASTPLVAETPSLPWLHSQQFAVAWRKSQLQDSLFQSQRSPLSGLAVHQVDGDCRILETQAQLARFVHGMIDRHQIAGLLCVLEDADEERLAFRLKPAVRRRF